MTTQTQTPEPFAGIYFYGTHSSGFYTLSTIREGDRETHLGDVEDSKRFGSATSALWSAIDEIRATSGRKSGVARVFLQVGEESRFADVEIDRLRYFGDLRFQAGASVTISAEAIIAESDRQEAARVREAEDRREEAEETAAFFWKVHKARG